MGVSESSGALELHSVRLAQRKERGGDDEEVTSPHSSPVELSECSPSPLNFAPWVEISLSSSSDGGSYRKTALFWIPNLKFLVSVLAGNNERGPGQPVHELV